MVYYVINDYKQIIAISDKPLDIPHSECQDDEFNIGIGFDNSYYFKDYMDSDEYKQLEESYHTDRELKQLRSRREEECFVYINRGELWYSRLTDSQKSELEVWYQAWLDVTETKVVPDKPGWLN